MYKKGNSDKISNSSLRPILNVNFRAFVLPGLLLLLIYPPFLRGLFFAPELLMTHMFTSVVFLLCWYDKILKRDVTFLKGYQDYSVFAFVLVYVFSLFGAVNMRGAVGELLKVLNYFMVYWVVAQSIEKEKDLKLVMRAIYFSAVGVALVGLAAAIGWVEYPGAVVGNRIYSTLQYPNTTATFLALATFLGMALFNGSPNKLGSTAFTVGNMLLMTGIVASQSRGSWFLYPLVLILFFVGLPAVYRFRTFYNFVVTLGVGLQVARVLQPKLLAGLGSGAAKYLVIGIVLAAGAQLAYDYVIDWLDRRDVRPGTRKLLGAGVVIYAVIVLGIYVAYSSQAVPSVAAQFVPSTSLARVSTINNQENSFTSRVDLAKAAWKMALDYPLNGLGGQGWDSLYHRYMPYLYYSSETHNYPAKVLVETGFVGLLIFVLIWGVFKLSLYQLWRQERDEESWVYIWGIALAAITLGAHSIYDFDLSMGAMGIVLWALWGLMRGAVRLYLPEEMGEAENGRKLALTAIAATVGAGMLFLSASSLYAAGEAGAKGAQAMTQRSWLTAEQYLLKATKLDPFTANYSGDLAQVYTIKGMASNDLDQIKLGKEYAQQAVKVEPYNVQVRLRLLTISLLTGNVTQAVKDAESLVRQNPLEITNYEVLGKIYIMAGRYSYEQGQKDHAKIYWQKVLDLNNQLSEQIKLLQGQSGSWDGRPLQVTPTLKLYQAEAAYYLGHYVQGNNLLKEVLGEAAKLDEPLLAEAKVFQAAVKAKRDNVPEANQEIGKLAQTMPGVINEFNSLQRILP